MLLALGADMQRALSRQFHDRKIAKAYIALVHGWVAQKSGIIDIPMRGDPANRPRQVIDYVDGKHAQTQWHLLGYEHTASGAEVSRLQLCPVTGRTHQLRVHCMALGHPVVGDQLYSSTGPGEAERMMLHAERLGFLHPARDTEMCLVAACEF
jgi:tRNA pseudouridine32 synthase/23S rRNA pseudouridine746 synthase